MIVSVMLLVFFLVRSSGSRSPVGSVGQVALDELFVFLFGPVALDTLFIFFGLVRWLLL